MPAPFESLGIRTSSIMNGLEVVDPTIDMLDTTGIYGRVSKPYGRPEQLAPIEIPNGGFVFLPSDAPSEMFHMMVALAGLGSTERFRETQYAV